MHIRSQVKVSACGRQLAAEEKIKTKNFKRDKPLDGLKVFSGFFFIAEYILRNLEPFISQWDFSP